MKQPPPIRCALTENSVGLGTVTREMILARARELALIGGARARRISKLHLAQAMQELTGMSDGDQQQALLESIPASAGWDELPNPIPVPASPNDDDDDEEGQNESARLVEEGAKEAEHDRMFQANRETRTEP